MYARSSACGLLAIAREGSNVPRQSDARCSRGRNICCTSYIYISRERELVSSSSPKTTKSNLDIDDSADGMSRIWGMV